MRKPRRPPDWVEQLKNLGTEQLDRLNDPEVLGYIQKANSEYWPWDELRSRPRPEGMDAEAAWALVKMGRMAGRRYVGLRDAGGRSFSYVLPDRVLSDLHEIDKQAAGSIEVAYPSLNRGDQERYVINSVIEEAIASSQIEGAATTRSVAKEMLRTGREPRDRSERMILNNYRTIVRLREFTAKPLSVGMVHDIHRCITEQTLENPSSAGRFRGAGEEIKVVDDVDNQVLHVPPPADQLAERMEAMCRFANEPRSGAVFVHPVVKGILLHFWLAYDHPYVDGNGRTARALFYWHMLRSGFWLFEYLSISRPIIRAPARYARAYLESEQDDCDATYFIMFHLRAIRLALRELTGYIRRKQREAQEMMGLLSRYRGAFNHRQMALLRHAMRHPDAVYTIRSHRASHGVQYATARSDLLSLAESGFLTRTKRGRVLWFMPTGDVLRALKRSLRERGGG